MSTVVLVQMPFAPFQTPSIALGLLKSSLLERGIECSVLYSNLDFAARVGAGRYWLLGIMPVVPEWTFARAAFGEAGLDEHDVLGSLPPPESAMGRLLHRALAPGPIAHLREVRDQADEFVEQVADKVLAHGPAIVGCTSTFDQTCASLALLRRIRERAPDVVTILGGAQCEGVMGQTMVKHFRWLDYVASGDCDRSFAELCAALVRGRLLAPSLLPHGFMTAGSISEEVPAPRAVFADLDRSPVPDYTDYFATLEASPLRDQVSPALPVETARGCLWGSRQACSFCGLNGVGMGWRVKSAARVLAELDTLSAAHGIRKIQMVDNMIDFHLARDLCAPLASRNPRFAIFWEARANVDRKQMERLADAGVQTLQVGIESLHDEVLRLFHKGTSALMNVQVLKWARTFGMHAQWSILYGAPGESDAWYVETAEWLPWLTHLEPPHCAPIRFDRFGCYHDSPAKYGLRLEPARIFRGLYPVPPDDLARLAWYFEDANEAVRLPRDPETGRFARPGLQAVIDRTAAWREAWKPGRMTPVLEASEENGGVTVFDTRAAAPSRRHELEGIDAQALLACEGVGTRATIHERVARRCGASAEAVDAALAGLVHRRLVLEDRGRFLGLACLAPVRPLSPS